MKLFIVELIFIVFVTFSTNLDKSIFFATSDEKEIKLLLRYFCKISTLHATSYIFILEQLISAVFNELTVIGNTIQLRTLDSFHASNFLIFPLYFLIFPFHVSILAYVSCIQKC